MAEDIPILCLGRRLVPAYCPLTRIEGDLSLSAHASWPGIETCHSCVWFSPSTAQDILPTDLKSPVLPTNQASSPPPAAPAPTSVRCGCPGVELHGTGLSAEVDVYRIDGRKRRSFLDLSLFWATAAQQDGQHITGPAAQAQAFKAALKAELVFPNAAAVARVDLKFVEGTPSTLTKHSDAWQERWRYYWNGERWVKKPPGASLHDWNKWGRRLEHLSASSPGSLPPPDGWPPVLDLPPGRYRLRILDLRWKTGRRGEPELEWIFRVVEGTYRGKRIFHRAPLRSAAQRRRLEEDLWLIAGQVVPFPEGVPFSLEPILEKILKKVIYARVCLTASFIRLYINGLAEVRSRQTDANLQHKRGEK